MVIITSVIFGLGCLTQVSIHLDQFDLMTLSKVVNKDGFIIDITYNLSNIEDLLDTIYKKQKQKTSL
jgi:hypothetical protein